jgi:hypothetical protein
MNESVVKKPEEEEEEKEEEDCMICFKKWSICKCDISSLTQTKLFMWS